MAEENASPSIEDNPAQDVEESATPSAEQAHATEAPDQTQAPEPAENVDETASTDAETADEPSTPTADPDPGEAADQSSDDQTAADESSDEEDEEEEPMVTPGMNWFVLRVASNKEDYVRNTLLSKIKIEGFTHLVNRILVPTEKVKQIKAGKQKIVEKKLYPGYVFVEMKLENDGRIPQDVFFLIKETTGVGDFIGTAGRPAPMEMYEVEKMIQASKPAEEAPQVKMEFQPGDHIKIKDGPFENTEGTVDELLPDQGKVRVIVQVFGRATPLELEYWQIDKFDEE